MAYNSDDAATRLSAVRDAIDRCLKSQAYSIGQRNQQMAQLRELRAMEKELMREASQASGGGFTVGQLDMP
jgi:hypothetical protein